MPIVALQSTARERSRIVARLDGPVSTPRSEPIVVVTEHGLADLRGLTLEQRAAWRTGRSSIGSPTVRWQGQGKLERRRRAKMEILMGKATCSGLVLEDNPVPGVSGSSP